MKKINNSEILKRIEQLENENKKQKLLLREKDNELKIAKSKAIKKEFSEIFINSKNKEFIKYSSLSETKRYFEEKHFDFLKSKKNTLTSIEFHSLLSELIKQ